MLRRVLLTALLVVGLGAAGGPAPASAAPDTGPTVMAAVGDSITRAFDVNSSGFLKDSPNESWATGSDSLVNSELLQLEAKYQTTITANNDAVTGAKMADLSGQMSKVLGQGGADYVTVLMGANDVCTKTVAGMTPTATFKASFDAAMKTLMSTDHDPLVFVSSIPNVNQLWKLYGGNSTARFTWSLYGVCQDLLSSRATTHDRDTIAAQVKADNDALAAVCGTYSTCVWDNLATYGVAFTTTDVSKVDYFHPSVAGQKKLAAVAWTPSPYGH